MTTAQKSLKIAKDENKGKICRIVQYVQLFCCKIKRDKPSHLDILCSSDHKLKDLNNTSSTMSL